MEDGIVQIDSVFGKQIGFTSDKFSSDSYLWKDGERVFVSLIISRHEGKGNLSALFKNIEALGMCIAVPTPFARMQAILERKGFVPHLEDTEMGACEVWEKPKISPARRRGAMLRFNVSVGMTELEVLLLLYEGEKTSAQLAKSLSMSVNAVQVYTSRLRRKKGLVETPEAWSGVYRLSNAGLEMLDRLALQLRKRSSDYPQELYYD